MGSSDRKKGSGTGASTAQGAYTWDYGRFFKLTEHGQVITDYLEHFLKVSLWNHLTNTYLA